MTLDELKLHADLHQDAGNMDEMRVALHAIGLQRTVDNLAALLRRLVRATKHQNDTSVLIRQIDAFLKDNELSGSNNILRAMNLEGSEDDCPKPAPGLELDARGVLVSVGIPTYKFLNVVCSQCGGEFGPGNHGFSHCENHKHLPRLA